MVTFLSVHPISNEDTQALPVRDIERAARFYTDVLGFSLVTSDAEAATLKRDGAQIGLVRDAHHDPARAGSCYFSVSDVEALRLELQGRGAKPGAIGVQPHDGKLFRLFFLRECDMLEQHDGYCFCFGQPA